MIVTKGLGSSLIVMQGYGSVGGVAPPPPPRYGGGGGVWIREAKIQDMRREEILRDDNEVFEWLCAIMPSLS